LVQALGHRTQLRRRIASAPTMIQEIGFALDSPLEEVGFELLVLQSSSSAGVNAGCQGGDISVMFCFRCAPCIKSGARQCYPLQASHTLIGKAGHAPVLSAWRAPTRILDHRHWACASWPSRGNVEIEPGFVPSNAGDVARLRIACAPSSTVLTGVTPARRTMLVSM